jgi:adenylate kinase
MSTVTAVNSPAAEALFSAVWTSLESTVGRDALTFPKCVFWLNGAPGAGKGTNTAFIMEKKGFSAGPVVVSDLLQTPEVRKIMDAGLLVGDKEVMELLFRKLCEPQFRPGVIVDGFPRTQVQCDCLQLLFNKINGLHAGDAAKFVRPEFHILVLDVSEAVAVERQLKRGKDALAFNAEVDAGTKPGPKQEIRKTDTDPAAAGKRYRVFAESTVTPLQSLKSTFAYHHIDAGGSIEAVRANLAKSIA